MAGGDEAAALGAACGTGDLAAMQAVLSASADPAMLMLTRCEKGWTPLTRATLHRHVDAMHLLLEHPAADTAAMLMQTCSFGHTALLLAAANGHVDATSLLLNHPSADPAAMLAFDSTHGMSALIAAAHFAADFSPYDNPIRPFAPLLLLLRRIAVELQPSDAKQAHMTRVVEALSDQ
ncbi:hypothetical protein FOA52_004478 [Chlamydomonas sp. UWO 241]|nr:hypothetical protein FOA52_004478 [Chlamydomonas sp. UWO 241]